MDCLDFREKGGLTPTESVGTESAGKVQEKYRRRAATEPIQLQPVQMLR
jgi:hypothetical protein